MIYIKQKKFIKWIFFVGIMLLIFLFSHQVGSDSKQISNIFVKFLHSVFPEALVFNLSFLVRKFAHFSIYFLLGFVAYSVSKEYTSSRFRVLFLSFLFCFFFAISDEVHQLFIDGRTGRIFDVFVDSLGSILGIGSHWVLEHFTNKKSRKS